MRNARILLPVFILIIVVNLATKNELLGRLTYLIGALLVLGALWARLNLRNVQIVRQTRARRAQVGQYTDERFIVRNASRIPKLWLEVRDESTLPGHQASRVVNALGGRRQRGWQVRTLARRRGRYTLGPIVLSSGDPLGLYHFEKLLPATSSMIVYPATIDLPRFEPPIGQLVGGEALRLRTQVVTTNVAGIRDYVPGDSFNRIHWPSTARKDRLLVKQFEIDPTADVWLILDMQRDVQVGELPTEEVFDEALPALLENRNSRMVLAPTTEEYGVTVAASIARHFLAQNREVGLITYGQDREVVQLDRGERQLNKILETLAVIRAVGRAPLEQILTAEERLFGRNSIVIVITPSSFEPWVPMLRELRRRGARSVAVLIEASTFGAAPSALTVLSGLVASGIPTYTVKNGDSLDAALGQRASGL